MLVTRTPFRISFSGGGSDLPVFFKQEPGHVISTSINKYMYIAVHPYFESGKTFIKYAKTEIVDKLSDINHPIVREVLMLLNVTGVDVTSIADIPAGTGLGSSSSYTVGLLHSLYAYLEKNISKEELSRKACEIEIDLLKEPIGKQDQYTAGFGGLNFITFNPDGGVLVDPINVDSDLLKKLDNNLLMFYIGDVRSASSLLKKQVEQFENSNKRDAVRKIAMLAKDIKNSLERGQIADIGDALHQNWMLKRELTSGITNEKIDHYYARAMDNGAKGGKLLGAGGGGFLLFYVEKENQDKLIDSLRDLRKYDFSFDFEGSKLVYKS